MMFISLQVLTIIVVASACALSLAHALELPGKMRLDKETSYAVQPIYYPGFTIGGVSWAATEPGSHHRSGDAVNTLWGLLDMPPEGRGQFMPKLAY
jgi:hypothetical protein